MALINRITLLEDVKFWILSSSTLSDSDINKLNEIIITKIGDDDTKYPEILYRCLEIAATKNSSNFSSVASSETSKEKLGPLEIQYFKNNSSKNPWPSWIKFELPIIAGNIGFTGLTARKYFDIFISPGDNIDIFDGQIDSSLYSNTF